MQRRTFLGSLLLAAATPAAAYGYLLPAGDVLRRAGRKLAATIGLQAALRGRGRASPVAGGAAGQATPAERWIFEPGRSRVEVGETTGPAAVWQQGADPSGDVARLPTEAERLVLPRLFAEADVSGLARAVGVDVERQALSLLGDRVAHVIGAGPREPEMPQIWIDQETWAVLQVRYGPPGATAALLLTRWEGPPTFGAFPGLLQVSVGGRWIRSLEAERVRLPGGR